VDQFAGGENTLELYRAHVHNHISPLLGHVKIGELTRGEYPTECSGQQTKISTVLLVGL
jgi:hypothetical protein